MIIRCRLYWCVVSGLLALLLTVSAMASEDATFVARSIELDGIDGEVSILGKKGGSVTWNNARDENSAFQGKLVNGVLQFSLKDNGSSIGVLVKNHGGVTVVESGIGNKVSVHVGNSGTSVQVQSKTPPRLELMVPDGVAVTVRHASGKWRIGDLHGPLEFSLSSGEADIGRVGRSVLVILGTGEIRVGHVTGSLKVFLEGSGELRVIDSQLDDLDVTLNGSGNVTVGGTAHRAKVMLHGTGNIEIAKVEEKPQFVLDGVGNVLIGGW